MKITEEKMIWLIDIINSNRAYFKYKKTDFKKHTLTRITNIITKDGIVSVDATLFYFEPFRDEHYTVWLIWDDIEKVPNNVSNPFYNSDGYGYCSPCRDQNGRVIGLKMCGIHHDRIFQRALQKQYGWNTALNLFLASAFFGKRGYGMRSKEAKRAL